MNDKRLVRLNADVVEVLTAAGKVLPVRLADISDAQQGWPRGSSGEGGGSRSVIWCETHEREVERCHREDELCDGVPIAVSGDPAGEAAMRPDRAAADRARLEELLKSMGRQAGQVLDILARYTPRQATEKEKRETLKANQREAGCESCARTEVSRGVPRWEPVYRRTLVDDAATDLCRWCWEWHRSLGSLPPTVQLEAHHRGQRVVRPQPQKPDCEFCKDEGEVVDGHGELSPCVCRMRSAS